MACLGELRRAKFTSLLSATRQSPAEVRGFAPPPRGEFACIRDDGIIPGKKAFSSICNDPEDPTLRVGVHPWFLHYAVKTNTVHHNALLFSGNRQEQGRDRSREANVLGGPLSGVAWVAKVLYGESSS